ncbi:hypothetical protein FUAX_30850 [Fulvitalea axinellae]|uniref:POTRA domain-containing protein n=1 Tax=Fulvitalea axinellae TaxID=1182444 RepID=A0AAU9CRC5_9BACT|nr:hypothetical protein FUAX_30850 [Fulvitalea axinellae]
MAKLAYSLTLILLLPCVALFGQSAPDKAIDSLEVSNVFILGNRKTKSEIILRELTLGKGQKVSVRKLKETLESDRQKVMNTRLFNSVKVDATDAGRGLIDIIVRLKERWYIFPSPIFRLADRNFNDWVENHNASFQRVDYGLDFRHYNFRGRNEKLKIKGQLGYTHKLELGYKIPYLSLSKDIGLNINYKYGNNNNIAVDTKDNKRIFHTGESRDLSQYHNVNIGITKRKGFYTNHEFFAGYHYNIVSDTILKLNPNFFLNGKRNISYLFAGYHLSINKKDAHAYPLNGYAMDLYAEHRGFGITGDVRQSILDFRASKYYSLGGPFYASHAVKAYVSFQEKQPYPLMKGIGFDPFTIRGYELYVIQGQYIGLIKNDLKAKIWGANVNLGKVMPIDQFRDFHFTFYGKLFADAGYVQGPNNQEDKGNDMVNKAQYSVGAGLDFVSWYDTVLSLEYAYTATGILKWALRFNARI